MTLPGQSDAPADLRKAGLAAHAYLVLEAARAYGFITGGPQVNVERCEELIAAAEAAGFTYTHEEKMDAAEGVVAWHTATPEERARALGEA